MGALSVGAAAFRSELVGATVPAVMGTFKTGSLKLSDADFEALKSAAEQLPDDFVVEVRTRSGSGTYELLARTPTEVHIKGFNTTGPQFIAEACAAVEEIAQQIKARGA
jgi:hypothetical protein